MPPKYEHRPPYRITYRYDCHFREYADTLAEAIRIGNEKHPEALICVRAGAKAVHVGIHAWRLKDKPLDAVYALFDDAVDAWLEGVTHQRSLS